MAKNDTRGIYALKIQQKSLILLKGAVQQVRREVAVQVLLGLYYLIWENCCKELWSPLPVICLRGQAVVLYFVPTQDRGFHVEFRPTRWRGSLTSSEISRNPVGYWSRRHECQRKLQRSNLPFNDLAQATAYLVPKLYSLSLNYFLCVISSYPELVACSPCFHLSRASGRRVSISAKQWCRRGEHRAGTSTSSALFSSSDSFRRYDIPLANHCLHANNEEWLIVEDLGPKSDVSSWWILTYWPQCHHRTSLTTSMPAERIFSDRRT